MKLYLGKVVLGKDVNIGDDGVKALMAAAGGGRLAKLKVLNLRGNNDISEVGFDAIAEAIELDWLPSLGALFIDPLLASPRLKVACVTYGVQLML